MMHDHFKSGEMKIRNKNSCAFDQWVFFSSYYTREWVNFWTSLLKQKAKTYLHVDLNLESIGDLIINRTLIMVSWA